MPAQGQFDFAEELGMVEIAAADGGADDDFARRAGPPGAGRGAARPPHPRIEPVSHLDRHVPDAALGGRGRRFGSAQSAADGHGANPAGLRQKPHG